MLDAVHDESDAEEKLRQAKLQEADILSDLLSAKKELESSKAQNANNREII